MKEKTYALFGIVAPFVAYISIGISIGLSPWFSWWNNALSDLGHATASSAAPIFNFGLLAAGMLIAIYSVTAFKAHAKYTSIFLATSAFSLQLVATFSEIYEGLHFEVSVLFFASIGLASVVYAIERKSVLSMTAFIIGLISWALWERTYSGGVAVPETISSVAVVSWILSSALRIYLSKKSY